MEGGIVITSRRVDMARRRAGSTGARSRRALAPAQRTAAARGSTSMLRGLRSSRARAGWQVDDMVEPLPRARRRGPPSPAASGRSLAG